MRRLDLKILLIFIIILQSCSKEETYTNLTEEAKELLLYDVGDTFEIKNLSTDEIITLTVNRKEMDYYEEQNPGNWLTGSGTDDYYEYGEYSFSDETGCYNGSVSVEARGGENFEFRIGTGDCFGEFLATPEFNNSLGFEFDGEIVSINLNDNEFTETYVLNTVNNAFVNTIFYTKENGIVQINDNQSTVFTLVE
mgnify:CR=1 FL=1